MLEKDKSLFYEIVKIIIEQIPKRKSTVLFFHLLKPETIDNLLQNLNYTKEQKEKLKPCNRG